MPHRFRNIDLPIGTPICLFGYDEVMGGNDILYGTIDKYIVLETPHEYRSLFGKQLDTGVVMRISENSDSLSAFKSVLLLLRYPESAWNAVDTNVFTYGILREDLFSEPESPLMADVWQYWAIQLAWAAMLMVADPPSETLLALQSRLKST